MPQALRAAAVLSLLGPFAAPGASTAVADGGAFFAEIAATSGLDFVHFNGMTGDLQILELTGPGSGLLDYDNDGDLDVYLVQGTTISGDGGELAGGDRLFRNDRVAAGGGVAARFVDVTAASGLEAVGYGMGVTAADFDDDGWVDLYVTNFGPNQMLRNNGDGTFRDVTARTGTDDARWSVPASFVDVDGDGLLDLYVGNYIAFDASVERKCTSSSGAPDYCGPLAYDPQGDRLFHNRGDGTFEDWSLRSGIHRAQGGALGAVSADFNGDQLTDIYVANDMTANQLWISSGDGTFSDEALFAGCAVNWEGKPEASMGVDAGDFDGDGDEDLFMVHISGETNTLYLNDGNGIFSDGTVVSGLASPSWNYTGFGAGWIDFDNDGLLDLLIVNGAIKLIESQVLAGDPYPLHQPNQLFRNLGDGRFEEVSAAAGPAFALSEVSRGAAFGDLDNDGDVDVVVTNNSGPARLLDNRIGSARRWIGLRVLTAGRRRDALGARIAVSAGTPAARWRRVRSDGSYASSSDPRVVVGLGAAGGGDEVLVVQPGGRRQRWLGLSPGRYYTLAEGIPAEAQ